MPDDPSIPQRIAASYPQLADAAAQLNGASDELWQPVSALEETLKRLNLGIEAWVTIKHDDDPQTGHYSGRQVGYAKVGHRWGIALRTYRGNENYGEPDDSEKWLFGDGPRGLRVEAVDHLPALLDELVKEANKTTAKIKDKIGTAQEIADAMLEARRQAAATLKGSAQARRK